MKSDFVFFLSFLLSKSDYYGLIKTKKIAFNVEPDDADRKKKTSKNKTKGSLPKPGADSKPNISYPTVS